MWQPVQPIPITAAAGGGGVPVAAGSPAPQKAVATPPPSSPAPPTAPARSARRKQASAAQQQPVPIQPTTTQPAGAPPAALAEPAAMPPTVQQPVPQSQISPEKAEERVITSILCMLLCPVCFKEMGDSLSLMMHLMHGLRLIIRCFASIHSWFVLNQHRWFWLFVWQMFARFGLFALKSVWRLTDNVFVKIIHLMKLS